MKALLTAGFLLSALALLPPSAIAENVSLVIPSSPEALLSALPRVGEEWKILHSSAATTLAETLETRAVRVYRAPVSADPAQEKPSPQAAGKVTIRLTDRGGRIPGDFVGFKPGKDGAYENSFLGSYPAITFTSDAERRVKVLLASRYVVELTFVNLPREKVESWLQALNFEGLRNTKSTPLAPGHRQFILRVVDELKPENNRQQTVTTSAAHEAPPVDDEKK